MKRLFCTILILLALTLSACDTSVEDSESAQSSAVSSEIATTGVVTPESEESTKAETERNSQKKPSSDKAEETNAPNQEYTVTFLYEGNTKTYTLKAGDSLTAPKHSNSKLKYVWSEAVPSVMPSKNVTYTATAIKGSFWELSTDGTLTVTGQMSDRSEYAAYKSKITSVVIGGSCPKVVKFAFEGCHSLKKADIGGNVTKVETAAFTDCPMLTSITLGSKVKTLEAWALNTENLGSLTVNGSKTWSLSYATGSGSTYGQTVTFGTSAPSNAQKYNQYPEYTWIAE